VPRGDPHGTWGTCYHHRAIEHSFKETNGGEMPGIGDASEAIRSGAADLKDKVSDTLQGSRDRLEINIHRHPMETVLISVGAGLLLGFVLGVLVQRRQD
jgi:hypothetical protein